MAKNLIASVQVIKMYLS